ncbi:hypothetical protein Cgig2_024615 [Carnegiea gigantea]|uniref:Neprosin activation peptide domain-containing protein n=1 Tax=Carnegiea gigantea TaxID=171969 RepID=A0A9Q1QEF1_9CARY|nr:hypothetical protein Cgig2_024615 [Carnegiea gigantea]
MKKWRWVCTQKTSTFTSTTQEEEEEEDDNFNVEKAKAWNLAAISPIIHFSVFFLLVSSALFSPVLSELDSQNNATNQTQSFHPGEELDKLRRIREHLDGINKTPLKTIQSVDGDLIDCVLAHQQPAFDHPLLKGQKPLSKMMEENFQLWHLTGETCPEGTIPIRRTTEDDMMRASPASRFGRKQPTRHVRRDSSGSDHEVSRFSTSPYFTIYING